MPRDKTLAQPLVRHAIDGTALTMSAIGSGAFDEGFARNVSGGASRGGFMMVAVAVIGVFGT